MDLEFRTEYWNDSKARGAFKSFILDIHNLDFNDWEVCGYWDPAYTPFSYFINGHVISSVCVYLLDAVIHGRMTKLVQISGVGTHQDYRKQGLSRELTKMGLDWAKDQHEGIFLFADEAAIPYYLRCGFSPINESQEYCKIKPVNTNDGIVQLNPSNRIDLDRIYDYANRRTPISHKFSILSSKLLMFHALYTMRDKMYEIPNLNCLVFFDRDKDVVNVYDILGETIPPFEELYPYICSNTDKRIDFHFHTDKLGINNIKTRPLVGNNAYVKGLFPVLNPAFPFTSRA